MAKYKAIITWLLTVILTFVFLLFIMSLFIRVPSMDFAVSLEPGWHTVIYPPWYSNSLGCISLMIWTGVVYLIFKLMRFWVLKIFNMIGW